MFTHNWVDATTLQAWANHLNAQGDLPKVVRRLIRATIPSLQKVQFPAGESVQVGGWDGVLEASESNEYVPPGRSVWEFGTNRDPKTKADKDYQKRCQNPLGIDPATTTFIFVTPRRWANKDAWVNEKTRDRLWAKMRVYDADDLEQWLEIAPAVHVWLALRIGQLPEGVRDLGHFWEDWISATEPKLSAELHLAGRDAEVVQITDWLQASPASKTVQAESQEEAIAFVASVINQLPDEKREAYLSRCLLPQNKEAWEFLKVAHRNLILIPTFEQPSGVGTAVDQGHQVLIPIGKANQPSSNVLSLPRLAREGLTKALVSMGVSKEKAQHLTLETRRSLMVLRRQIARDPSIHQPAWAKPESARSLLPVLLAGDWDDSKEADRKIIEEIARKPYAEVVDVLARWVNESDPPVRRVGTIWQAICRDDSWQLLSRFILPDDWALIESITLKVLGELDPRYELLIKDRFAAPVYGKVLSYSGYLREGVAETLAYLATNYSTEELHDELPRQDKINSIVYQLMNSTVDWKLWASLGSLLVTLAEAAPDIFLKAVEVALAGNPPVLQQLFHEEEPIGNSPYVGLLWALETFASEPRYLSRVSLILCKLARLDPGGKLVNRPFGSLGEIFLSWSPQTPANLEQRLRVLDLLLVKEPEVAWKLLCSLLPDWRRNVSCGISQEEFKTYVDPITDRLIKHVGEDSERWCDLINIFIHFQYQNQEILLEKFQNINVMSFCDADRLRIWKNLNSLLRDLRLFSNEGIEFLSSQIISSDDGNILSATLIEKLSKICQRFESQDFIHRYAYLFSSRAIPPNATGDWQTDQQLLDQAKLEAVKEIYSTGGLSAILVIAEQVEFPADLGFTLGRVEDKKELAIIIINSTLGEDNSVIKNVGIGFVSSFHQSHGWEWEKVLLSENLDSWSAQKQADFIRGLPFKKATWELLASCPKSAHTLYWKQVRAWGKSDDPEFVVRSLLDAERFFDALDILSFDLKHNCLEISSSLIIETLKKINYYYSDDQSLYSDHRLLNYHIEQAFCYLDKSQDVDESQVVKLEWAYFSILRDSRRQSKLLYRKLSKNPHFFIYLIKFISPSENEDPQIENLGSEQIAILARQAYELLNEWHHLPGLADDGSLDSEELRNWITEARNAYPSAHTDYYIGQLLAFSPTEKDDSWPISVTRDLLEELASVALEDGFVTGVIYPGGFYDASRPVGEGGRKERELENKYRDYAKLTHDGWPRTAALLNKIADIYKIKAYHEDRQVKLEDY